MEFSGPPGRVWQERVRTPRSRREAGVREVKLLRVHHLEIGAESGRTQVGICVSDHLRRHVDAGQRAGDAPRGKEDGSAATGDIEEAEPAATSNRSTNRRAKCS